MKNKETLEEAFVRFMESNYSGIQITKGFVLGAMKFAINWQKEQDKKLYSDEDMLEASKYGYNFHKTTQFPNQEFEDSCIRNTQQWFEQFKKK